MRIAKGAADANEATKGLLGTGLKVAGGLATGMVRQAWTGHISARSAERAQREADGEELRASVIEVINNLGAQFQNAKLRLTHPFAEDAQHGKDEAEKLTAPLMIIAGLFYQDDDLLDKGVAIGEKYFPSSTHTPLTGLPTLREAVGDIQSIADSANLPLLTKIAKFLNLAVGSAEQAQGIRRGLTQDSQALRQLFTLPSSPAQIPAKALQILGEVAPILDNSMLNQFMKILSLINPESFPDVAQAIATQAVSNVNSIVSNPNNTTQVYTLGELPPDIAALLQKAQSNNAILPRTPL